MFIVYIYNYIVQYKWTLACLQASIQISGMMTGRAKLCMGVDFYRASQNSCPICCLTKYIVY